LPKSEVQSTPTDTLAGFVGHSGNTNRKTQQDRNEVGTEVNNSWVGAVHGDCIGWPCM